MSRKGVAGKPMSEGGKAKLRVPKRDPYRLTKKWKGESAGRGADERGFMDVYGKWPTPNELAQWRRNRPYVIKRGEWPE